MPRPENVGCTFDGQCRIICQGCNAASLLGPTDLKAGIAAVILWSDVDGASDTIILKAIHGIAAGLKQVVVNVCVRQQRSDARLGCGLCSADKVAVSSVEAQGLLGAEACGADLNGAARGACKLRGSSRCLSYKQVPLEGSC